MSARAVSIVGHSGAGKTTLLLRVVPALCAQGLAVSVLKHSGHPHPLHREGSDTARLAALAGVRSVGFGTPEGAQLTRVGEGAFEEVLALCARGVDLVLVEGWKDGPLPKVEVWRTGLAPPLATREGVRGLQAWVSEVDVVGLSLPRWSPALPDAVLAARLADLAVRLDAPVTPDARRSDEP